MGIFKHNRIWKTLGCVSVVLIALLLVTLLPGNAEATKHIENTYAVVITGGSNGGEYVQEISLRYVSSDGQEHLSSVEPHNGGLYNSLLLAKEHTAETNRVQILKNMGLSGFGEISETVQALQPYQTDTYFFTPEYEVKEILGLEIACQASQGEVSEWLVQGLRIYRVGQIRGLQMDGYYGNDYSVRFDGKLIASMEEIDGNGGNSFSLLANTRYDLSTDETADKKLIFNDDTVYDATQKTDEYTFRLTFADYYGAGYELLTQGYDQKESLLQAGFGEMLVMQIEYLDIYGDTCRADVPVITATIGTLIEKGISPDIQISGLAQQGESIAFNCYLPQMQSVTAVTMYNGTVAHPMDSVLIMGSESANVTALAVYPAESVAVAALRENNSADLPLYSYSADPISYYAAPTDFGEEITADYMTTLNLAVYEPGASLQPQALADKYTIELYSDKEQIAYIPDDLMLQLSYVDVLGEEQMTEELSIRELSKDFYGYWPASDEDFAYESLLCSDEGIRFVVEMADVDYFTGILMRTESSYSDFKVRNFSISRLDELKKRQCTWGEIVGNAAVSNRVFTREVGTTPIFHMDETFLIEANDYYDLQFVSKSVIETPNLNWSDVCYSMTYEESCSNLGFMHEKEAYTVEVRVHGGATVNDVYGDSGSKNRFYFCLEFENGRSGYVLANGQLGADGFRSGCNESFTIFTNRDYGELKSVRIIPDDIFSGSDPNDKLNVDEIRVCKESNEAIIQEWIIENVGWVGVDYHDENADSTELKQQGRTESELVRSYPVTKRNNAINLEFCISTATSKENTESFKGSILASLDYYDNSGNRRSEEFDLIDAMYRYMNQPEQYLDNAENQANPPIVSDPTWMFRENHTDRFILSLSDVAKLEKLTLRITSYNGNTLSINDVSVSLITSSGILLKNDQNEYFRNHKVEYLCSDSSDASPAYELSLTEKQELTQEIYFTEHNEIKMDDIDNSWIAAISRTPESKYDEVNIFVYPADDIRGEFTLDATVQYTDYLGHVLESEAIGLMRSMDSDGNEMYYLHGVGAAGITTLNKLYLQAQSDASNINAYIDHALVQQVRDGVIISTYYFNCNHKNASEVFAVTPSADATNHVNEQTLMLMFGERTQLANLVPEERDIAVAIRYTIANDTGDREYTSRYVYLTEQDYWSIDAGNYVTLNFYENYVKEVTGIVFSSVGNLSAQVEMACVANYNISSHTGIKEQMDWFSFANALFVGNNPVTMQRTFNQEIQPLTATFVTAEAAESFESGTASAIKMKLCYADSRNAAKEIVINDIRDYVISEGTPFATGSTTQIALLLKDPNELRWVEFDPYDGDSSYFTGWNLAEVQMELGTDGCIQRVNRRVNHYIQEGNSEGFRVNLTNITLSLNARALTDNGGNGISRQLSSATNNDVSLIGISGMKVIFENIKLTNTTQGFSYRVERVVGDEVAADVSSLMNAGGMSGSFNIPENTSGREILYRVTIYSREATGVKVTIHVLVDPVVIEPEPTEEEVRDDLVPNWDDENLDDTYLDDEVLDDTYLDDENLDDTNLNDEWEDELVTETEEYKVP
ncbi:MAG: hypothetical protein E7434_00370 [Ruminococcaceae bacterium]|nr:hypothetical protein [Oscillospiraceae bacterium]